jgi:hypothetical protein
MSKNLSILSLTISAWHTQLVCDVRFIIIYNGEVYSHEEIWPSLIANGSQFSRPLGAQGKVAYQAYIRNNFSLGRAVVSFDACIPLEHCHLSETRSQERMLQSETCPLHRPVSLFMHHGPTSFQRSIKVGGV